MGTKIEAIKNFADTRIIKKYPRLIVIFIFIIILLIGVFNVKNYGVSWDEYLENYILKCNVASYVNVAGGQNALQSLNLANLDQIATYKERDHGESMYYAFYPVGYFFRDNINTYYTLKHLYTFLIFFGALVCLYLVLKNLTKRRLLAILGVLLMFLSPRMFGESFYNLKDMVLMSMIIVSFYFGYKLIETRLFRYGVAFAVAMAFTSNTRIMGFWLFGLVGLLYLATVIKDGIAKNKVVKPIIVGAVTLLAFIVAFWILTPAAWSNPINFFKYTFAASVDFTRWDGFVMYMNNSFRHAVKPLPWHYIPVLIAVTTPIVTLLLIIFGIFDSVRVTFKNKIRNCLNGNQKYYILLLIFAFAPLIVSIVKKSNLYNGWRHFYFIYGALIILAVGGVYSLLKIDNKIFKRVLAGVISLQLILSGAWIARNPGVQYAYFNPLAINASKNFEIDYWNVSVTNCLIKFLDSKTESKIKISAVDWYSMEGLKQAYDYLPKKYADRLEVIPMERRIPDGAQYIISNTSYQNLVKVKWDKNMDYTKPFVFENLCKLDTSLIVDGHSIMNIYRYLL